MLKKLRLLILVLSLVIAVTMPASASVPQTSGTITYATSQGTFKYRAGSPAATPTRNAKPWWSGTIVAPDGQKGSFIVREGEQLETVTNAHPELLLQRRQTLSGTNSAYPDCSFYRYSPCMQHSSTVIDSVGGLYYAWDFVGPIQNAPCPALNSGPCPLSGSINATVTGGVSASLTISTSYVQAQTGMNASASVGLTYTTTISIPPGMTGSLGPELTFGEKDFWTHRDNSLCYVEYDALGTPYYSCSYYDSTYGSGTIKQVTSVFKWYQNIY